MLVEAVKTKDRRRQSEFVYWVRRIPLYARPSLSTTRMRQLRELRVGRICWQP